MRHDLLAAWSLSVYLPGPSEHLRWRHGCWMALEIRDRSGRLSSRRKGLYQGFTGAENPYNLCMEVLPHLKLQMHGYRHAFKDVFMHVCMQVHQLRSHLHRHVFSHKYGHVSRHLDRPIYGVVDTHVYRIPNIGWPYAKFAKTDHRYPGRDSRAADDTDWTGQHWCAKPGVSLECRKKWPKGCPEANYYCDNAKKPNMAARAFLVREPVRHAKACKRPKEWLQWQGTENTTKKMITMKADLDGMCSMALVLHARMTVCWNR